MVEVATSGMVPRWPSLAKATTSRRGMRSRFTEKQLRDTIELYNKYVGRPEGRDFGRKSGGSDRSEYIESMTTLHLHQPREGLSAPNHGKASARYRGPRPGREGRVIPEFGRPAR
jgi:hypothetical protein